LESSGESILEGRGNGNEDGAVPRRQRKPFPRDGSSPQHASGDSLQGHECAAAGRGSPDSAAKGKQSKDHESGSYKTNAVFLKGPTKKI